MRKVIYIRVSKEEKNKKEEDREQNPEDQIPVILHTFKLNEKDCDIIIERVSAYDDNKQEKRLEFIQLKENIENKIYNEVYVFSLERFERNIKRMLMFYFFCENHECKLYSALQPYLNNLFPKNLDKVLDKNPIYTFLRYLLVLIYAFLAENESWFIGMRTRKAFKKIKNSSYSTKFNKKVGNKFKSITGEKIDLGETKENEMFDYIFTLISDYEDKRMSSYFPLIIDKVKDKYGVLISRAYLSNIKKKVINNG